MARDEWYPKLLHALIARFALDADTKGKLDTWETLFPFHITRIERVKFAFSFRSLASSLSSGIIFLVFAKRLRYDKRVTQRIFGISNGTIVLTWYLRYPRDAGVWIPAKILFTFDTRFDETISAPVIRAATFGDKNKDSDVCRIMLHSYLIFTER